LQVDHQKFYDIIKNRMILSKNRMIL